MLDVLYQVAYYAGIALAALVIVIIIWIIRVKTDLASRKAHYVA